MIRKCWQLSELWKNGGTSWRELQKPLAALYKAAEDMARYYDQNKQEPVIYKVGNKVWLEGKDIKTDRPCKKLEDKRYGPYRITKVVDLNAYQLHLPPSMKVYSVFNTVKLRPALEDTIIGRKAPARPAPVVVGNASEWKVEYIKDSRLQREKLEYLVKWKDYP